ncbi:MAG: winged helix-turn-helix domain-containing protein, partial [Lysobacter sp.]|nr:winged helix-turn-helix domain-containing protein [Lysobacter sp.]
MRKSYAPPPPSLPSERLRLGDRIVDLSLREIAPADGVDAPMRVTLKSIGVLTALIEDAGKLVTRDALIERVWPNTLPTDDVLTQAVTQLRKAFRDECERPQYIETVSKRGYRLIASVHWLIETERDLVAGG